MHIHSLLHKVQSVIITQPGKFAAKGRDPVPSDCAPVLPLCSAECSLDSNQPWDREQQILLTNIYHYQWQQEAGMKVTFLLLVFALWPQSCLQPGRQRRSWPQPDHAQRHQHKLRFYRSSSAGPHSSHGISFGHHVPESGMGRTQLSLSDQSFPESSSLGSVTASSLILSRDHHRRLEHSQGYRQESRQCFTGWVTIIARLLATNDLLTASLRKFFLLE